MRRLALLMAALALAGTAGAQNYPSRPVKMLVGYSAGGGADALARIVAAKLSDALGQQVVVENRPGAGATLAADAVAKAAPDGYTLYFADTAILIAPSVYAKVSYDPVKSFAPVGNVCALPLTFVVNPAVPAATTKELIALFRANPGKYSYGSPGIGTVHHLAFELFKKQTGADVVHVPYKGAAAIIPDVVSGELPVAVLSAPPALAQSRAGKLRVIALTSPVKLASAPEWPALADTLPGFDASPRLFVLAPVGTPQAIIVRLNEALKAVLALPDVLQAFAAQGATAVWTTPEDLAVEIATETRKWSAVAQESGAKLE